MRIQLRGIRLTCAGWPALLVAGRDAAVNLPPAAGGPVDISKSARWADPQFGVKGTYTAGSRVKLDGAILLAPVSKASWDLSANMAYSLTDYTSLILGYRYLTVNRDKPSFKVDTSLQGPVVGLDFHFWRKSI